MKNRFIFALSVLVGSFMGHSLFAQSGEDTIVTTAYDTVVVFHHPEFSCCDTTHFNYHHTLPTFSSLKVERYYCDMVHHTQSTYEVYDSIYGTYYTAYPFSMAGRFFGRNNYLVEAIAQPFHFDSMVTIVGVAAHVRGEIHYPNKKFHIADEKFNYLTSTAVYPSRLQGENGTDYQMGYYYFSNPVRVNNCFIVGEQYIDPHDTVYRCGWGIDLGTLCLIYDATYSIYDPYWQDTLIGCQSSESPWLKRLGEWKKFEDDSIYSLVQKSVIDFNPIIVLHPAASALLAIDLDKTCSVFPNPAKDEVIIQSNFKIRSLELWDMAGRCMIRKDVAAHETKLDISTIPSGSYALKLHTEKGIIEKKVIKE